MSLAHYMGESSHFWGVYMKYQSSSSTGWGQRRIQGRGMGGPGPPVPLFLYQTEARRAEKKFGGDQPPSQGLDDRLPPLS